MWNRKVFIRIVEVLLCISCVVALRVTDDESRRVFTYLRYRSREWSLLNNVTWGSVGAALASATCGGYLIITTGLLIAAATGELAGRKTETFLLGLGVILFAIVGALSLSSIESVPSDLIDNGAVLGALCIVTALIFIADILMSSNQPKKHRNGTNMVTDPKLAKHPMTTTLTTEKETSPGPSRTSPRDDAGKSSRRNSEDRRAEEPSRERAITRAEDESRNRQHEDVERQTRPYTQNVENGRGGYNGDNKRYPMDTDSRNRENRDDIIYYRKPDFYQRPVDETDTPPFPNDLSGRRSEPIFKKMINPGIKIMQVDRDVDDNFEGHRECIVYPEISGILIIVSRNETLCKFDDTLIHETQDKNIGLQNWLTELKRYSDSSQYDNVPTRMRNLTHSILKKQRDVSFNVPPPPRSYGVSERTKDDIEMLEECFGILRTTSTATQTRPPSSAFDPGFVRHTASNWPREANVKTPGTSPDRDTNY